MAQNPFYSPYANVGNALTQFGQDAFLSGPSPLQQELSRAQMDQARAAAAASRQKALLETQEAARTQEANQGLSEIFSRFGPGTQEVVAQAGGLMEPGAFAPNEAGEVLPMLAPKDANLRDMTTSLIQGGDASTDGSLRSVIMRAMGQLQGGEKGVLSAQGVAEGPFDPGLAAGPETAREQQDLSQLFALESQAAGAEDVSNQSAQTARQAATAAQISAQAKVDKDAQDQINKTSGTILDAALANVAGGPEAALKEAAAVTAGQRDATTADVANQAKVLAKTVEDERKVLAEGVKTTAETETAKAKDENEFYQQLVKGATAKDLEEFKHKNAREIEILKSSLNITEDMVEAQMEGMGLGPTYEGKAEDSQSLARLLSADRILRGGGELTDDMRVATQLAMWQLTQPKLVTGADGIERIFIPKLSPALTLPPFAGGVTPAPAVDPLAAPAPAVDPLAPSVDPLAPPAVDPLAAVADPLAPPAPALPSSFDPVDPASRVNLVETGNKKAKPIPAEASKLIGGSVSTLTHLATMMENLDRVGWVQGLLSEAGALAGQDQGATDFKVARGRMKVAVQDIIKGIPSNFDVKTIIQTFATLWQSPMEAETKIRVAQEEVHRMVRGAVSYYKGMGYDMPELDMKNLESLGVSFGDIPAWDRTSGKDVVTGEDLTVDSQAMFNKLPPGTKYKELQEDGSYVWMDK